MCAIAGSGGDGEGVGGEDDDDDDLRLLGSFSVHGEEGGSGTGVCVGDVE